MTFGTVGAQSKRLSGGEPADVVVLTDVAHRPARGAGPGGGGQPGGHRPRRRRRRRARGRAAARHLHAGGASSRPCSRPSRWSTWTRRAAPRAACTSPRVLQRLGIADAVKGKTVPDARSATPRRPWRRAKAEICVHQISEILPVKGVTLVGPLPRELQKVTTYSRGAGRRKAAHARSRSGVSWPS